MIEDVERKTIELQQTTLKRKVEEEKLAKESAAIASKEREIQNRQAILRQKQEQLEQKEAELESHRIFSQFLEAVVQDKSGDKEGFVDILDLQNRFKSLRNENGQLLKRKKQIETQMKEAKNSE